jgi:hypothetical protein
VLRAAMHRSSRRPNVRSRRCWSECGEHNQRVPEPIYIRLRIWGSGVRISSGAPNPPQNQILNEDGGNRSTRTRSVPVSCPEVQPHPIALWGEQTARHFLYFDDDRNPDLGSDRGVKVGLDLRRLNSNDQRITSDFFPRAKMRTLIPPAHRWIDGDVAS